MRGERGQLQFRGSSLPEGVAQAAAKNFVHERLFQEPHFGLRRVHVDVDAVGRDLDEEMHLGAALLDRRDAIGLGDRVRDGAVFDDAAVDEDVLGAAHGPLVAERGDVAVDLQAGRFLADLDEVRPLTKQLEEALAETLAGGHSSSLRAPLVRENPTVG